MAAKKKSVIAGSHKNMVRQNEEIDRLKLPRIVNETQLNQLINDGELVEVIPNETLQFAPASRRYVRPWCRTFAMDMAVLFHNVFHRPIIIDSAVRTADQQHILRRVNRFAAPEWGELPSSHLAGITVDIAKRKYTTKERKWIVDYLKNLQDKGLILAAEEPMCYHVAVRERYFDYKQNMH